MKKRRGAWVVDWYDFGKRRVKAFATKREAEDFAAEQHRRRQQHLQPTINPHVTLAEFIPVFLERCSALEIKPTTLARYDGALRVHVLPALGHRRVRELDRAAVEAFIIAKRTAEEESRQGQRGPVMEGRRRLARGTVLHLLMTLSAVMRAAVASRLLLANPLSGLTKDLRLTRRKKGDPSKIKAFDQPQLARFLRAAAEHAPDLAPAYALMGLAGLRLGEALALQWSHLDLDRKRVRVFEQLSGGTKTEGEREIEMADYLHDQLADLLAGRRAEAFRRGEQLSPYVCFPEFAQDRGPKTIARVMKTVRRGMARLLQRAGLPLHHTPHSLRHSFASILISKGKPIAYVRQALGHASITMTVDTYGSWLPVEAPGAVNLLAEGLPVTKGPSTGNMSEAACPQMLAATGTSSPRPSPCPRSPCTCT